MSKYVVLHRANGVLVAERICCNVSSDVRLESFMLQFRSLPAFPWWTYQMTGDTQFEPNLLNWCTTMKLVSETMKCEPSITSMLHYFQLDLS